MFSSDSTPNTYYRECVHCYSSWASHLATWPSHMTTWAAHMTTDVHSVYVQIQTYTNANKLNSTDRLEYTCICCI